MSGPSPVMPPLPPSREEASLSELVPLRSSRIRLWKSPFLPFGIITAIVAVYMFGTMSVIYGSNPAATIVDQILFNFAVLVGYILFLLGWMVHFYARSQRTVLYYVFPLVLCYALLSRPVLAIFILVFRQVLPGATDGLTETSGFLPTFVAHFFGAGLMEEAIKGTAALLCVASVRFLPDLRRRLPAPLADLLSVRGPLDGLLMGVAAGAMFIFVETAGQYAVRAFQQATQATHGDIRLAWGYALTLLLPRTFGGIAGHMAYAGVFGYFIGLSVIRPARAGRLILIGWVSAAVLHALWNSSSSLGPWALYVAGGLAAVAFLACLLKARQIEATAIGGADTGGSIIVGLETPAPAAPAKAPAAPPPAAVAPRSAPMPAARPLVLVIGSERLPLAAGAKLDLGTLAATAGRGTGLLGEVVPHPRDPAVLGLRNAGTTDWTATLVDGRTEPVTPAHNVRLAAGVRIVFADGLVGLVVAS